MLSLDSRSPVPLNFHPVHALRSSSAWNAFANVELRCERLATRQWPLVPTLFFLFFFSLSRLCPPCHKAEFSEGDPRMPISAYPRHCANRTIYRFKVSQENSSRKRTSFWSVDYGRLTVSAKFDGVLPSKEKNRNKTRLKITSQRRS